MGGLTSLVLVTYNSAGPLPEFLRSLAGTEGAAYELIAVDNASSDGTAALLRASPGARLIASPANEGFGRACNRGAAAARGDAIVFLNPDLTFTPGWLAALRATLAAEPRAAIVSPATPYPGEEPPPPGPPEEAAAVPGSAMAVRREAWADLGGFDERIFMYWEDVELCWRARLLGWRVLRDPTSVVFHARGGSGGGGSRWDGEAARAGLYVHLKLMRWRVALPFAARLAAASLAKGLLGRPGMAEAWRWNARGLGETLAARRALAARRREHPAALEALAARHVYARRRPRR